MQRSTQTTGFESVRQRAASDASGADAVGVIALEDGETTGYVFVSPEYPTEERQRLRHEVFKSLVHYVGQKMNPLALLMGGGPPEPRRDQPSLGQCDDDRTDAIEAIEGAEAFVIATVEHGEVAWDRPEGASYGGGLATRGEDREKAKRVLDATLEFASGTSREEILRG